MLFDVLAEAFRVLGEVPRRGTFDNSSRALRVYERAAASASIEESQRRPGCSLPNTIEEVCRRAAPLDPLWITSFVKGQVNRLAMLNRPMCDGAECQVLHASVIHAV